MAKTKSKTLTTEEKLSRLSIEVQSLVDESDQKSAERKTKVERAAQLKTVDERVKAIVVEAASLVEATNQLAAGRSAAERGPLETVAQILRSFVRTAKAQGVGLGE